MGKTVRVSQLGTTKKKPATGRPSPLAHSFHDYCHEMRIWEQRQRFRKGVAVVVLLALLAGAVWLAGKGFGIL